MEIRRLRGKLSARRLAERTKELGHEVTRAVLADLETGRRRHITVAELTVLARALNTTPVALLYPDPIDGDTQLLPGVDSGQRFAMQWFSGHVDSPSAADEKLCDSPAEYRRNIRPVEVARRIWELDGERAALMKDREGAPAAEKREYLRAMTDLTRQIDKLKGEVSDGQG